MHSDTQLSLIKEATSPGSNNDLFLVAPLSPTLTCFLPSLKCKFTLCVVHLESGRLKEKTRTSQSLGVSVGALLEELNRCLQLPLSVVDLSDISMRVFSLSGSELHSKSSQCLLLVCFGPQGHHTTNLY